jgi:hypothetical protein
MGAYSALLEKKLRGEMRRVKNSIPFADSDSEKRNLRQEGWTVNERITGEEVGLMFGCL